MSVSRMVFSCIGFRTFRVAIFDVLHRRLGKGFTVVARSGGRKVAHHMGKFRRKIIRRIFVPLSYRKYLEGQGTPMGLDWSPVLPFVIARLKPQIVISENFGIGTLQAFTTGYPTVIYWQGWSHTERTVQPWRKRVRRWMAKRAKAFIANGSLAKSYLVDELGIPEHKIFIGGNGAEPVPEKLRPVTARKVQNCQPVCFLFVGRLVKGKGVDLLLKAAATLKSRLRPGSTFKLTILGSGPERAHLEELVSCLQLTELIHFIDNVPPSKVWEYYSGAHVFVLPTLQDTWANVVTEAMSMGMPIVLSKYAGSAPELIQEGKNGYTFDPENQEKLSRLMGLYIERPEWVEKHGECSLEIVATYNPERMANVMLSAANYAFEATKKK